MLLGKLQVVANSLEADFRATNRIVHSQEFETVYGGSSEKQKHIVLLAVRSGNAACLRNFVKTNRLDIEQKTFRELRGMAQVHNITGWYTLNKQELIHEILTQIN